MREVKKTFKPELLNRIDDLIVFHQLDRNHIRLIVDLLLRDLESRVAEQGFTIRVTDATKEKLADEGFDPVYGARPLKRTVETQVENVLAHMLIAGEFAKGDTVSVDVREGRIVFERCAPDVTSQPVNVYSGPQSGDVQPS
jgi:ATP-dependent Clp protease ATP-binding subunit ClpC